MFTLYILINQNQETYVRYTENLDRRLMEHNSEKSGKHGWTYARGPWLVLHSEEFSEKSEAIKREKWYKSGVGRRAIQSMKI